MIRILDDCEVTDSVMGGTDEISPIHAVSLNFGDVCLANVVNYSNFEDDPTQVLLCEKCGEVGCSSVGWVHLRRIGEDVIWIPPIRLSEKDPEFLWEKFPPPYFTSGECGIPVFGPELHDKLRAQLRWLPARSEIQPIRVREALALLQSEAPFKVLGRAPDVPRLQHDQILAVAEGELRDEIAVVNAFAESHAVCDTSMRLVECDGSCQPIEFFLDAPRFPAWRGFCRLPNGLGVILSASEPSGRVTKHWVLSEAQAD